MSPFREAEPWIARTVPFFAYISFMALSGFLESRGFDSRVLYAWRVGAVALVLIVLFRHYHELSWPPLLTVKQAAMSIGVGVAVFLLWIQLDHGWMVMGTGSEFNPYGSDGQMDFSLILMRGLGAALVVPLMEELFWRSFIMRWIDQQDFLNLLPARVTMKALLVSAVLFALEHTLWFAGLLAGLAYGWLYMRSSNLWSPVLAHAVTNGVLGVWVVTTGNWKFW